MTTAPNIEMIASSLRHCSLSGGGSGRRRGGSGRRRGAEGGDDSEGVTVELNSDVALPYHWEQCLDIRTGQVYYNNWEDGTRTTVDPRTTSAFSPTPHSTSSASRRTRRASTQSSGYTSVSSVGADVTGEWQGAVAGNDSGYDNDDEEEDDEEDGEEEEDEDEAESSSTTSSSSSSTGSSRGSAVSSTLSSFSPTDESGSGDNGGGGLGAGHVLVAAGCRACFMYFMVPKRADVCPKCGSSGLLHLSRNDYA
ncbi:uncharacterized protein DDB_G0271670-like [Panicum virgatum]|uniref:WW domain-containing protein n=1 Tax=Panicum virgatum TaxID=38727 RepID=A0A8T0XHH1_PANVG|nr:uncharacterized protein DDB_G0271670-like [Panicum virgatum]KAG2658705.1 hypothetical protein PVAP13_1KG296800 [Panicum virgatum]